MAKWIACMAHIKHSNREYIKGYIDNRFEEYIIAYEKSDKVGEHIHFLLWSENPTDYHKLAQNVFKQKFTLRGKATKGKCRQYGKVKNIENIQKMMSYTVKDENCDIKSGPNLTPEIIEEAFQLSFKKEDNLAKIKKALEEYIENEKSQFYKETCTGDYVPDGFTLDRHGFAKEYTRVYMELFERAPTRNMIINQIIKYDKDGISWYLETIGLGYCSAAMNKTINL